VDAGTENSWMPAARVEKIGFQREKEDLQFIMANGQVVTRSVGFAVPRIGKTVAVDEVVFTEPGDLVLLRGQALLKASISSPIPQERNWSPPVFCRLPETGHHDRSPRICADVATLRGGPHREFTLADG
jgi:hypothetical protein